MTEPDVIDNPNHAHYGPARRLFVIISAIAADMTDLGLDYFREWGSTPFRDLSFQLYHGVDEAPALREIVGRVLHAIKYR